MPEQPLEQPLEQHDHNRNAMLQKLDTLRQEVAQLEQELNIASPAKAIVFPAYIQQLQEIVDFVPAVIYIKDLEGRYLLVNREFEKKSGLSSADTIGKKAHELFPQELTEFFSGSDREAIATNQLVQREWRITNSAANQDNSYVAIVFPLHDMNGKIYATYGTITNIIAHRHDEEAIRISQQHMQAILDNAPAIFYIKDVDGRYLLINRMFESRFGLKRSEVLGKTDQELFPDEQTDRYHQDDQHILVTGTTSETEWTAGDSTYSTIAFPLPDEQGKLYAVCGIALDVSARKHAETIQRQTLIQEEIIRAQELTLAELTTPLLSISEQAVVMPLIGAIDSHRAQEVIVTLLEGVSLHRAQVAILDITGVAIVDTQVANALVQAAQAVQLLGAQVIITGIRPEIAQTLVNLGVNLRNIMTLSSLRSGIAYALRLNDQALRQRNERLVN